MTRKLGRDVFEALSVGAGMVLALAAFFNTATRTTGYLGIGIATVVLLAVGIAIAWCWRRYQPLAGMALVLLPCWLLAWSLSPDKIDTEPLVNDLEEFTVPAGATALPIVATSCGGDG